MKKKYVVLFIGVFLLSTVFGNISFGAAPNIPGVTFTAEQTALSSAAKTTALAQLDDLETYLNNLLASPQSPPLTSAQEDIINQTITRIQKKRAILNDPSTTIEIYFTNESSPGDDYSAIYNYYKGYSPFRDIDNAQLEEMWSGFSNFPGGPAIHIADEYKEIVKEHGDPSDIPPEFQQAWTELKDLIDINEAKAAAGASGNERVSILTFYLKPPTSPGGNYTFHHGTTLVIATEN